MGIILVFLICHMPRNILNIHEVVTSKHAIACKKQGLPSIPLWAIAMSEISYVLLTINSSTNSVLYIFLNNKFRLHFISLFKPCYKKSNIIENETQMDLRSVPGELQPNATNAIEETTFEECK